MRTGIKLSLLAAAVALAVISALGAARTVLGRDESFPEEVYARYAAKRGAEYLVGIEDGYVAVYKNGRGTPERVTRIEAALLRRADEAMLRRGIPAEDMSEVLSLLEDLGG